MKLQPVSTQDRCAEPFGDILVCQYFEDDDQASALDPAFMPCDHTRMHHKEYSALPALMRFYHTGQYRQARYSGVVGADFGQNTCVRGSEFCAFIENSPGYDVYFINPKPHLAYFHYNVWSEGETCYPGLTGLANILFQRAQVGFLPYALPPDPPARFATSNIWVGNVRFWDAFMDFLISTLKGFFAMKVEPYLWDMFFKDKEDRKALPLSIRLIFDRLFSTFLSTHPQFRSLNFPYSKHFILHSAKKALDAPNASSALIREYDRMMALSDDLKLVDLFLQTRI